MLGREKIKGIKRFEERGHWQWCRQGRASRASIRALPIFDQWCPTKSYCVPLYTLNVYLHMLLLESALTAAKKREESPDRRGSWQIV